MLSRTSSRPSIVKLNVSSFSHKQVFPLTFTSDYEQYYASLAASAAASAQATPSGLSAPGSSDFDDFGEEEDRKPNIEYLDSLNDYRKRSRSREDEGVTGKIKVPKVEEAPTPYTMNGDISNNVAGPDPAPMDADNDPIVYGTSSPFLRSWGFP